MVQEYSRNHYVPRPQWVGNRLGTEQIHNVQRHHISARPEGPPVSIHCPFKYYFVAIQGIDGHWQHLSGPGKVSAAHVPTFFSDSQFEAYMQRKEHAERPDSNPTAALDDGYQVQQLGTYHAPSRRPHDRRRRSGRETFDGSTSQISKRRRNAPRYDDDDDDDPAPVVRPARVGIKIGDHASCAQYYDQQLRNIQQILCKVVAKAWVKAVEPKKQTNYPYTSGQPPPWWPKPWGSADHERVPHKEPDHLLKEARLHLLKHILKVVISPGDFPADEQIPSMNVSKLEEITTGALLAFCQNNGNARHMEKEPFLKELLRLAKAEESCVNGERDADDLCYVKAADKLPDSYKSEPEDEVTIAQIKSEGEGNHSPTSSGASSMSVNIARERLPEMSSGHGIIGPLQPQPYISSLPVRSGEYPASAIQSNMTTDHQLAYVAGPVPTASLATQSQMQSPATMSILEPGSSLHNGSRRASLYHPTNALANTAPTSAFQTPWPSGTAASGTAPMYAYNPHHPQQQPQQHGHALSYVPAPSPALSQEQQYLGSSFDSLNREYGPNPHPVMFRNPGPVHHGDMHHPHSYPGYMNGGLEDGP